MNCGQRCACLKRSGLQPAHLAFSVNGFSFCSLLLKLACYYLSHPVSCQGSWLGKMLSFPDRKKLGRERGHYCMHSSISMNLMILDGCICLAGLETKHVTKIVWLIKGMKQKVIL